MKISRTIIALLVLIFITGVSTSEVRAWSCINHRSIVEEIINTEIPEVNFSSQELELLYKAVILPDEYSYRRPNERSAVNLHGRGNYVATLKYLYELAFKYLENQSNVDDTSFINNYFNECDYLRVDESERIAVINLSLIKLLTSKILFTASDYELSNRNKAIKILGFACHLAGDIYAHDTIVPVSAVSYRKYDPSLNFKRNDFISTSAYSSRKKWSVFKSIIRKYNVAFFDLDNLNTASAIDKNGSTIKLKTLYDEKLLASIGFDIRASLFEDNPNFHSTRFDATFTMIKEIIFKFNSALYANENKQRVDDKFNKNIFNYYSKYANSSYKLRDYEYFYFITK